jgi:hypothetical protein
VDYLCPRRLQREAQTSPRRLSIRQFAASPALALAVVCAGFGFNLSPARAQTPTPNAEQYGLVLIGAEAAWQLGYTGTGVTVAVGDTGIDQMHPAFAGKIDSRSKNFQQGCAQVVQDERRQGMRKLPPVFPQDHSAAGRSRHACGRHYRGGGK